MSQRCSGHKLNIQWEANFHWARPYFLWNHQRCKKAYNHRKYIWIPTLFPLFLTETEISIFSIWFPIIVSLKFSSHLHLVTSSYFYKVEGHSYFSIEKVDWLALMLYFSWKFLHWKFLILSFKFFYSRNNYTDSWNKIDSKMNMMSEVPGSLIGPNVFNL